MTTTATAEQTMSGNGAARKATVTTVAGFPGAAPAAEIHGWIVSWELDGMKIPFDALRAALRESGLDESIARSMLPANAFRRAARKLSEGRIIRQVGQADNLITFQFTAEYRRAAGFDYALETLMELDTTTGAITSGVPELTEAARLAFDEALVTRTTSDVTSVIQRLFNDKRAAGRDLIPLNRRGVYWVRKEEGAFLDRVEDLVGRLGGQLTRLPVAAGTPGGDRAIKEATAHKMEALIADLEAAVGDFGAETSERSLVAASERVKLIRHKIVSYQAYLDDAKGRLDAGLTAATQKLRAKILEIGQARAAAPEATDAAP